MDENPVITSKIRQLRTSENVEIVDGCYRCRPDRDMIAMRTASATHTGFASLDGKYVAKGETIASHSVTRCLDKNSFFILLQPVAN